MNNLAYRLIQNYKQNPDKVCLIKNRNITYKELYFMVANFRNYLLSQDIKKGDKVLVLVPMSIELYVSLLAIWSIGATACFMDEGFIKNGINKNDFDDVSALIGNTKYILYSSLNSNLRKLRAKININKIYNVEPAELKIEEVELDSYAILTYTSGTTGKPKITARTHEFLANQGKILEETLNYESQDIELSSMPIFTLSNINVGITTVIADGFFADLSKSDPVLLIKQIENNGINRIMAAPGLLEVIIRYALDNNRTFDGIKKIFTGGGAVFMDLINNLKRVFPNAEIVTIYGSTEAEPIAELNVNDITEEDLEHIRNGFGILVGKIVGVDDCRLIQTERTVIGDINSETFQKLQSSKIGEIVVSGKNVLKGYMYGIGDAENKFTVDGVKYHRTGDVGYFDEQGRLWLRGRLKQPYYNVEAALHSRFNIGKTACFKHNGKLILVLENLEISERAIHEYIRFEKIDMVKYVDRIPVDKRHSTKVDYQELLLMLGL